MEKNDFLENILSRKQGKYYDIAVMYSGGKDSSFLLYLLKEVYKLRVIACFVDNGFENNCVWENIENFTKKMDVPLKIIKTQKDDFNKTFNTLIVNYELFKREKTNHICFICNNFLWVNVVKFAGENDIPYVASGLSLMQLSSGRPYPLEPNKLANSIAEKSTKQILKNSISGFKKSDNYNKDYQFKCFIDKMSNIEKNVTTVYPYIYHQISVNDLKNKIAALGWKSPNNVELNKYISSGCSIMKYVIPELEKMGIITLNERNQAKVMMKKGLLDKSQLKFATYDATHDVVDLSHPLFDELDVREFLMSLK